MSGNIAGILPLKLLYDKGFYLLIDMFKEHYLFICGR